MLDILRVTTGITFTSRSRGKLIPKLSASVKASLLLYNCLLVIGSVESVATTWPTHSTAWWSCQPLGHPSSPPWWIRKGCKTARYRTIQILHYLNIQHTLPEHEFGTNIYIWIFLPDSELLNPLTLKSTSPQQLHGQRGPSIFRISEPASSLITNLMVMMMITSHDWWLMKKMRTCKPWIKTAPLLLHSPDHRSGGRTHLVFTVITVHRQTPEWW